ncbi:hypothetical protein CEXT_596461 [Caerostris extrusa]|uniref:Uncharacterized protein n=1 Tax=Caerostris extrusa TaxID=172846 RepID=A0AAV4MJ36_CAEEX|nr:hypothetical protein CEXT_596461 [Caerostris extrusa]
MMLLRVCCKLLHNPKDQKFFSINSFPHPESQDSKNGYSQLQLSQQNGLNFFSLSNVTARERAIVGEVLLHYAMPRRIISEMEVNLYYLRCNDCVFS